MLSKENLSPYFISCCMNEIQNIFKAKNDEVVGFVEWHTKNLINMSNEYYFFENGDDGKYKGLDTVDRDVLYDCIARYFTSFHEWPLCGNDEEHNKKFLEELSKNAFAMLGWELYKY